MNRKGVNKIGCIITLAVLIVAVWIAASAGPTYFGVTSFKDECEAAVMRMLNYMEKDIKIKQKIQELAQKYLVSSDNPNPIPDANIKISRDMVIIDFEITFNLVFTKIKQPYKIECKIMRF